MDNFILFCRRIIPISSCLHEKFFKQLSRFQCSWSCGQTFVHPPLNWPLSRASEPQKTRHSSSGQKLTGNLERSWPQLSESPLYAGTLESGRVPGQSRRFDLPRLNLLVSIQMSSNFGRSPWEHNFFQTMWSNLSHNSLPGIENSNNDKQRHCHRKSLPKIFLPLLNDLYTSPSTTSESRLCGVGTEVKNICRTTLSS